MDKQQIATLNAEVGTIVRLRKVDEAEVVRRIMEFLDWEFHGVVPLPLEARQPEGRELEELSEG